MFNYIKAHRKNWGLTQKELGFLIGFDNNVRVSQLEKGKKKPNFKEAIMFELLFDKSSSRIFPDIYHEITKTLLHRLELLNQYFIELKKSPETERILQRIQEVIHSLETINGNRV